MNERPDRQGRRLAASVFVWVALLLTITATGCTGEGQQSTNDRGWTARRLNRSEYDRTVRDLLGTSLRPARSFPSDERGNGYDTMSALLSISPEHMAHYERAAEELATEAVPRLFACDQAPLPAECAIDEMREFLPRAWRRPVQTADIESMMVVYRDRRAQGDDVSTAMVAMVTTALMAPQFLFRAEHHPLRPHEMASRLSYFLWSSMPDDELLLAADFGELADPDRVRAQVMRMLDDDRSRALVDDFAGQWLHFRGLDDVFKDAHRYPAFDEDLRASMRAELTWFFASFVGHDRDFRELLVSRETRVDERLMGIYGRATAPFEGERDLDLSRLPRSGLLTMPGLMTILSRPFRTAPVQRGAWVLGQLQCAPPPPPPAAAEGFDLGDDPHTTAERLAAHRRDPACASCHDRIDPIGLALEEYDAIGSWRSIPEQDRGGTDGVELARQVAEDPAFTRCVVQQTMTYALGRTLNEELQSEVDALHQQWAQAGFGSRTLFALVASSPAFMEQSP